MWDFYSEGQQNLLNDGLLESGGKSCTHPCWGFLFTMNKTFGFSFLSFLKKTQGDFLGVLALRYLLSLEIPLLKNSPLCYSLHTQKSLYIMWTNQRKLFIILHYLSTFLPGPFPHFEYKSPLIYSFVTLYICNLNFHLYPPHSILSMRPTLNCIMPHIPERIIRLCVHTTQLSLWYHWKEASLANYRSCSTGVTVTGLISFAYSVIL